MDFSLVHLVVYALIVREISGDCTWPSVFANSQWEESSKGTLTFGNNSMTGWSFRVLINSIVTTIDGWKCHSTDWFASNNTLILRTVQTFNPLSVDLTGYLCWRLEKVTDKSYRYYIQAPEDDSQLYGERVLMNTNANLTNITVLCSIGQTFLPSISEYRILIKSGSAAAAKLDCPYALLGTYGYMYTPSDSNGITCSTNGSLMNVCTDYKQVSFNYSTCTALVANSNSNTVWCVDTVPVNDIMYTTVYNGNDNVSTINNATTFRFSCLAVSVNQGAMSVSPQWCRKGQTPTDFPNDYTNSAIGATVTLTRYSSCASCPRLTAPSGGSITYTTYGAVTTASYNCDSQYSLSGAATRTCQSNITWTDVDPKCTCSLPIAPVNGSISVSSDGSTLIYSCNVGFVLVGTQNRTCQSNNNTWLGTAPVCNPCNLITDVPGLTKTLMSSGRTTQASFTCSSNYTLSGTINSTCLTNGSWSSQTPSCVACDGLSYPASMTVIFNTDGYTSSASLACVTGYIIVGQTNLTCNTSGKWSANLPSCNCQDPATPANGAMVNNGSYVSYSCNLGYSLNGLSNGKCLNNGTGWNTNSPTCVACVVPTNLTGGHYNLTTTGLITMATYVCNKNYTMSGTNVSYCQPNGSWNTTKPDCVQCSSLAVPNSGAVNMISDGFTTVAVYTCASAYNITGDAVRTCLVNGSWTGSQPSCSCTTAQVPAHGTITVDQSGLNVYYQCNLNYSLSPSSMSNRQCTTNGTGWSGTDPSCNMCLALINVDGGNFSLFTDGVTTKAAFSCNVGFTINGNKQLTCLQNGSWNSTQPNCTKCNNISAPSGGNMTLYSVDSTITNASFTCNLEYTLNGYTGLTCQANGAWDYAVPTCSKCVSLSAPSSGNVTLFTDGFTTTASFSCASGYQINGKQNLTCLLNSTWNNPQPTCDCTTPNAPTNGNVTGDGKVIKYSCNVGYTMSGEANGLCLSNGTGWNIHIPTCVSCNSLPLVTGGNFTYVSNGSITQAVYHCNLGYSLLGSNSTVSCNSTGGWMYAQPKCASCSSLPAINVMGGSVTLATDGVTTTGTYSCPAGYSVQGSTTIICTTNGTWNSTPSTCVCNAPNLPVNGSFTLSIDGMTAWFSCEKGYTISGASNMTCATNGSGWSASQPMCHRCNDLNLLSGGNITLVTSGTQTTAVFSCDLGFTLRGVPQLVCSSNGTWNYSQATCVSCPSLPSVNITGASVTQSTNGVTTVATYLCPLGYETNGSAILTCTDNGTWNSTPSTCVCKIPTLSVGGTVTLSPDGMNVTIACMAGYTMIGTPNLSCAKNGSGWSTLWPNCTKCDNLTALNGGNVTLITSGTQTSAIITCGQGSSLQGVAQPICLSNGTWSSTASACVSCNSLPALTVSGGNVTLYTNGATTTANYSCPQGYEVKGSTVLTCNSSGNWDSVPSSCVCKTPSTVSGGNFTLSGDSMTITFACMTGYTLNGSASASCATNGSGWTSIIPTCSKCDDITQPVGGNITLVTTGTQTTAVVSCAVGSTLNGVSKPNCTSNGTWDSTSITCVTCPAAANISSGSLNITSDGQTTYAVYTCSNGYYIVGSNVIACLPSGAWNGTPPTCYCSVPDSPSNGSLNVSNDKSTIVYSCNQGFTIKGNPTRTCQNNGMRWTGSPATCNSCSTPNSLANGTYVLISNGSFTFVTYSCDVGFSLSGSRQTLCKDDGTWNEIYLSCVKCPSLSIPTSGKLLLSTDNITTSANVTCDSKYYLIGEAYLNCSAKGEWSSPEPICVCNNLTNPVNGSVTISNYTTSSYTCDLGFSINGVSVRTCAPNGSGWTDNEPSCVTCNTIAETTEGQFEYATNGTATFAKLKCNNGTSLSGSSLLACSSNGTWNTAAPTCVTCLPLNSSSNGILNISSDGITTTSTLTCLPGYDIVGDTTRKCLTNGTWSGAQPSCRCISPETPNNGFVRLWYDNNTALYSCDLNYTLNGPSERICRNNGLGWSDTNPECVSCRALSYPESGSVVITTNGTVTTANYTCSNGYNMTGKPISVCGTDGKWSTSTPQCQCVDPPQIANGGFLANVSKYYCNKGYSINGTENMFCSPNGSGWNGTIPNCVKCENLTSTKGYFEMGTNTLQTTATLTCTLGTTLNGPKAIRCMSNGKWDAEAPSCVSCPALKNQTFGSYVSSTDGTTTSLQLECHNGYQASGWTTVTCGSDGKWQYQQESICEEIKKTTKNPLEAALIAVSVIAVVIITMLSISLARFIYLYLRTRSTGKYDPNIVSDNSLTNESVQNHNDLKSPIAKLTVATAPLSHQHHVLTSNGRVQTPCAPTGCENNVFENQTDSSHHHFPPCDTNRSQASHKSTVSTRSVNGVFRLPLLNNPNQTSPYTNRNKVIGELNCEINALMKEPDGNISPSTTPRSGTPLRHFMTNFNDKSISSVSAVDD